MAHPSDGESHAQPLCSECNYAWPAGASVCPVCGNDRGLQGAPYPSKSFRRFKWVWAQRLGPRDKSVLLALVHHDMPNGTGIFPSVATLVEMTSYKERAMQNALKSLRDADWIEIEHRYTPAGRQKSSLYVIKQPELAGVQDVHPPRGAGYAP